MPDDPASAPAWIEEAADALEEARYRSTKARSARTACQNAQLAAELGVKAVLIAKGEIYEHEHDMGVLLNQAARAGEAVPASVQQAGERISIYLGADRYRLTEKGGTRRIVGDEEHRAAIGYGETIISWAQERVQAIMIEKGYA